MKASATMTSLVLIILMLAMSTGYVLINVKSAKAEEEMAFKKSEILKVENTFYLINDSLEATWRVSSIQSIFDIGDGLGLDYWYKGEDREKTIVLPENGCNDGNPRLCLPNDDDILKSLTNAMTNYLKIKDKLNVDGIDVDISEIKSEFSIDDDKITSEVAQKIDMSYGDTKIITRTMNKNIIQTKFKKLVSAGIDLVNSAIEISDKSENKKGVEKYFDDKFNEILEKSELNGELKKDVEVLDDKVHYRLEATFFDEKSYNYIKDGMIESKPFFLTIMLEDYLPLS